LVSDKSGDFLLQQDVLHFRNIKGGMEGPYHGEAARKVSRISPVQEVLGREKGYYLH
jgi:hypothetical protein